MRLLHYIEIENFKRFGEMQRIELDHPAVLIGPNNCGKTSAIQALALWSQGLKTWFDVRKDSSAKERTATALNRLNIVAVPVQRTRFFWHNTHVRAGTKDIAMTICVGVAFRNQVIALRMRFTNKGDEVVYCKPDDAVLANADLLAHAASINIELLYPMSGLETEEPVLQPGRINVLLGQGQTAQVLRNLCLMVAQDAPDDWTRIVVLMKRLFGVTLDTPVATTRGAVEMKYRQPGVREALDMASSGRGFQQMLLIFAYLYSHKGSVLMVDEPDAHLEILRQRQIYVLLREIASDNHSQVIMVTHSEVILDEALDKNLTLLMDGKADDLASKRDIQDSLRYFGANHYITARERGYVLYVEGSTDVAMLRAFADRIAHPILADWDERVNTFYVQATHPVTSQETELERVEGGFGVTPRDHFNGLRKLLPQLKGVAILDGDARDRVAVVQGDLQIVYWRRYEIENYFVTPDVLQRYAIAQFGDSDLFGASSSEIQDVLDAVVLEQVFDDNQSDFEVWQQSPPESARLVWDAQTQRRKLSRFAEEFFRRLAQRVTGGMLLKKGELHRLIAFVDRKTVSPEVTEKLNLLHAVFKTAKNIP